MAEIFPFRAFYYNTAKVDLGRVLSPPYDIISPEHQNELYTRHSHNVVRLEYGRESDRYASAAKHLRDWMGDGALVRDSKPAVYILCQTFRGKSGEAIQRKGFVSLCKVEDLGSGMILPHERTFPKPKQDRLELLSHTKAQFSPIFSIYADPSKMLEKVYHKVSKSPSLLHGDFEDTAIDVWGLSDHGIIGKLQEVLRTSEIFIADGHHRYETALEYQKIRRAENPGHNGAEGYNYTLMYFSNIEEEGLVIYPIHRVVRGIEDFQAQEFLSALTREFSVERIEDPEQLILALREQQVFSYGIALAHEGSLYLATLRERPRLNMLIPGQIPAELKELDVVLLHEYILPHVLKIGAELTGSNVQVEFIKDEREALAAVQKGDAQVAFLLRPTRIDQLQAVARAGQTMPQKSTYFHPKLPAGLIMFDLERF